MLLFGGSLEARRDSERRTARTARTASCALIALVSVAAVSIVARVANAEDAQLEEIVVTGSRIPRVDFESASPILSVPSKTFERTQAVTVELVLNTLPQFVPSITNTTNAVGDGVSAGQANVDLRGLGALRHWCWLTEGG